MGDLKKKNYKKPTNIFSINLFMSPKVYKISFKKRFLLFYVNNFKIVCFTAPPFISLFAICVSIYVSSFTSIVLTNYFLYAFDWSWNF